MFPLCKRIVADLKMACEIMNKRSLIGSKIVHKYVTKTRTNIPGILIETTKNQHGLNVFSLRVKHCFSKLPLEVVSANIRVLQEAIICREIEQ